MCKMMDMALANMDSNYDFIGKVGIDRIEEGDFDHFFFEENHENRNRKTTNRGDRRRATKKAKKRRQKMAKYSYDLIMLNFGKVKDTGWRSYEKGDKVYSRKLRHERFSEPMPEMDMLDPEVEYIFNLHDLFYSFDWDEEEMFLMGFDKNGNFEGFDFGNPTLYQQMPVLFNEISAYLRCMEKLDKLEEKREELLRKLEELDMDMAHIRGCLKDIF